MRAVFAIFALLAVVASAFGVGYWVLNYQISQSEMINQQIAAEVERSSSLKTRIAGLSSETQPRDFPSNLSLVVGDEIEAELELQKTVLETAENLDIAPLAFGPSGPVENTTLNTVSFELEFEASYTNALEFLTSLEGSVPPIALETLSIRQIPAGGLIDAETPVYVRTRAWSFWAPGGGEN